MPSTHVRSVVPNPWDPAAPPGYLVGMYDLMFLTREILQPRSDTSYTFLNCCSLSVRSWSTILIWFAEPVRSCSPILIPCSHVRPYVLSPRDHATPFGHLICTSELMFRIREILKSPPDRLPSRHVRSVVPNPWEPAARPDTLYAYSIWCSLPVRSCSPILIPRRHVRSDVPNPWDPAALSWYPVGMYDMMFRAREICSLVLIPCRHVRSVVPKPWDPEDPSYDL